jgi:Lon protease-like protein
MTEWENLPLFPLNTVLFPGMVLPLHIFEDRYKLMVNHCLEKNQPFGVVLIREGRESGDAAIPYSIGTTAVIAKASKLNQGKMNIVTVGSERFRLSDVRQDRPYLLGTAEPWPLVGAKTDGAQERVEPARVLFQQYLDLLVEAQGHKIEIEEVPTEARTLALLMAIALQVSTRYKQHLLSQPTIAHMLHATILLLRREHLLLEYIIRTQGQQWEGGSSGYLSLN